MLRLPIVTDYATCSECGGACCQRAPGEMFPADVWGDDEPDWARIRAMLGSGRYSVDWWEGDKRKYYLRPATVDGRGRALDPSWGGPCDLLTDDGCSLSEHDRPTNCRTLTPDPTHKCGQGTGKEAAKDAWARWSEELYEMATDVAAVLAQQRAKAGRRRRRT